MDYKKFNPTKTDDELSLKLKTFLDFMAKNEINTIPSDAKLDVCIFTETLFTELILKKTKENFTQMFSTESIDDLIRCVMILSEVKQKQFNEEGENGKSKEKSKTKKEVLKTSQKMN